MPKKISLTEKAMWDILDSKKIKYFIDRHLSEFNPDIVIPLTNNKKLIIFVDGCFYHICPTHRPLKLVETARDINQIEKDKVRMEKIKEYNDLTGISFWEHDIKERPEWIINEILKYPITYGQLDKFTLKQKGLAGLPPTEPPPIQINESSIPPKTPKYQIVLDGWFSSEETAIRYGQSVLPKDEGFRIMKLNGWYSS